jgi:hypothetical protein
VNVPVGEMEETKIMDIDEDPMKNRTRIVSE